MADISSIFVNNESYMIKDAAARSSLSGKEDSSNKTQSIRTVSSASETLYPSEKAVASAISSSSGSVWGSIAGDIGDQADLNEALSDLSSADSTMAGEISEMQGKIPSDASSTNKLVSYDTVNGMLSAVEAKQLYRTASQGSFETKAQLLAATTFYDAAGASATPTKNDVAYVLADESHDGKTAKYVVAAIAGSTITWGFVITFSDISFSQTQMNAVNSGITSTKRSSYDSHIADTAKHVTSSDKTSWNSKVGDVKVNGTSVVSSKVANLGALAGKGSASGSYTPAGSVQLNETEETIASVKTVGTLPTFSANVSGEVLSFSFSQGSLPTTESKTVIGSASPTFSGAASTITVE